MDEPLPKTKARQGRTGFPVLVVLIAALILLGVGWLAVGMYGDMIEPADPVGDPTIPRVEGQSTPEGGPAPTE